MNIFLHALVWVFRHFDGCGPLIVGVFVWLLLLPFVGHDLAGLLALVVGLAVLVWLEQSERGRAFRTGAQQRRTTLKIVAKASDALLSSGLEGVRVRVSSSTSASIVLELTTPVGRTDAEVLRRADALAAALGAWRCVPVPGSVHGSPRLLVQQFDPLAASLVGEWSPAVQGFWDSACPVPVGRDEAGNEVSVSLWSQTVLVGGSPGAGKSAFAWLPMLGVALDPSSLVVVIDLKPHGIETAPISTRADHAAYDPEAAVLVLRRVWKLIDQRNATLREHMRDKVPTDARLQFPSVLIVVDEAAELGHTDLGKEALQLLQRIVAVGRASGVSVMLSTQKPDATTIPTNLRDLFAQRVCFRVGNRAQAETVLGVLPEGAEPWKIPTEQAGTGYLVGTDGQSRRFRSMFLERAQVVEIADRAAAARCAFLEANPSATVQLPPIRVVSSAEDEKPRRRRRS